MDKREKKDYQVTAMVTISVTTKVKANSKEEALNIASSREDIVNGLYENDKNEFYQWIAEDYDGTPYDLTIEELKSK